MSSSSNYPRHNDEEGDDCAYYQRHDDFAVSGVEAASSPPSWTFVDTTHNINNTHTTDNNYNQRLLSRDNSIHVTDEVFNSISHLSAAMLSLLGMVLLIAQSGGNAWKIVSFSVYGSSLLFLFCCSTLHHAISGTAEVCTQAKRERERDAICNDGYLSFRCRILTFPCFLNIINVVPNALPQHRQRKGYACSTI